MSDYGREAWLRLGRAVKTARKKQGLRSAAEWNEATGISARTLLGLERGQPVSDETITRIEKVLGWPSVFAYTVLTDPDAPLVPTSIAQQIADKLGVGVQAAKGWLEGEDVPENRRVALIELLRAASDQELRGLGLHRDMG